MSWPEMEVYAYGVHTLSEPAVWRHRKYCAHCILSACKHHT